MEAPSSEDFFTTLNQEQENPIGEVQESSIDYTDNMSVISNTAAKMLDSVHEDATGQTKKMSKKVNLF